jgi:hypothetical protein
MVVRIHPPSSLLSLSRPLSPLSALAQILAYSLPSQISAMDGENAGVSARDARARARSRLIRGEDKSFYDLNLIVRGPPATVDPDAWLRRNAPELPPVDPVFRPECLDYALS